MADWELRLRPGMFRGVPFQFEVQEVEGGRQVQTVGIPTSETHVSEDLGRMPQIRNVTAYVIGDLVTINRDALKFALDQPGPGLLGLALWPDMLMHVTSYVIRESKKRLGYCELDIGFVEASRAVLPATSIDTGAALLAAASVAVVAAVALFGQGWSVTGPAASAAPIATDQVSGAASALGGLVPVGGDTVKAADFRDAVDRLEAPQATLLAAPDALASAVRDVFTAYCAAECETGRAEAALARLETFEVPVAGAPMSVTGAAEAANGVALTRLVRHLALIERVRVARVVPLASRNDARALEERLSAGLSDEAEFVADLPAIGDVEDAVYRALNGLTSAVVSHLEARAASLEPLVLYARQGVVADLVLAYDLYGTIGADGQRASEVAGRNKAIHPGYLPGEGQALAA